MRVLEASAEEDLRPLLVLLSAQGVRFRSFEERGLQIVEAADEEAAATIRAAYTAWREGQFEIEIKTAEPDPTRANAVQRELVTYPATWLLVAVAVGVFLSSAGLAQGRIGWLSALLIAPQAHFSLADVLASGEWWRLLTPMFVHFSATHILFNGALSVHFGRQLEPLLSSTGFLLLVAASSLISNLAQWWWSGSIYFGGLSGVVYGLVGFALVASRLAPHQLTANLPITVMLILVMVVFSSGVTEAFGLFIANAAHWAGFATGLLGGAIVGARWKAT